MKKTLLLLLTITVLGSCQKDRLDHNPIDLEVALSYYLGEGATSSHLPLDNIEVTLVNLRSQTNFSLQTDAQGRAIFEGVAAGEYDINASVSISKADYEQRTGQEVADDMVFNASVKNYIIDNHKPASVSLELINGQAGDFVIKQVYYAGSDNREGALFRDQFVEIYNNTAETLYADSLFFGVAYGRRSMSSTTGHHYQANGQLDWSKSVGNTAEGKDLNKDYLYLAELYMIPGSGKTYPVEGGKSIIIAQNAMNHKVPFIGNNGREVSVKDPSLTIDLSGADFEAYFGDLPGINPLASDIDNPTVPNVEIIEYTGRDLVLDNPGRDSYVIFKNQGAVEVKDLPRVFAPTLIEPTESSKRHVRLPEHYVTDAVEIQPTNVSDRIPKKMQPHMDAGFTFVPEGSYSSQAVIRKTRKTENGRVILQDTNNSTEDFTFIKASPRGFVN